MAKHRTGHLFKRGKTFYIRWAVAGKVFSKALHDGQGNPITTRREAEEAKIKEMAPFVVADEAAILESIAAKLEGRKAELAQLQDEQNPPLAIAKAWLEYLADPNRPDSGESTLRQYECQFSAFARWMREKHPDASALRNVSKEIAEEYAAHLTASALSANSYNKHLNLLTLVFRVLKDKAKLTGNPWAEIQRKRLVTHSRRELTFDELMNLCQRATGELRNLLALGLYSGLRLGDCATLRWGEVDLRRGIIRRIPNKTARRNPKPVIVPIHRALSSLLAEIPAEQRAEYVLPEMAALYQRRVDLVTDKIQQHFMACGLKPHQPGTGRKGRRAVVEIGFHSLRHSFVSLCRENNVPLSVVESIVGHSNPAMTRHYTHVGELAAAQAVAALPAVTGLSACPAQAGEHTAAAGKERGEGAILREMRAIAESMTADNWEARRAELLAALTW